MSDQDAIPTADTVETFVASWRQRAVPVNTIKSYAHDLHLFAQAAPPDLTVITPEHIQSFLTSDERHSTATRRRRYSTLCTFYHWLLRHDIVEANPMDHLDPIEQVEREPRPLPPETVSKILQAIPASNLRDRTLFEQITVQLLPSDCERLDRLLETTTGTSQIVWLATHHERRPQMPSKTNVLGWRQGRFHDRGYEAQLKQASSLSLVINAIAV